MKTLPPWLFRASLVIVWLSLAFWSHMTKRWGLFGFGMFAAGEAWGRLFCEIKQRRLERTVATFERAYDALIQRRSRK